MLRKLYGIDYNTYACGGIGDKKIAKLNTETTLFLTETDMLKALIELKENHCVGEVRPFTTEINREQYRL